MIVGPALLREGDLPQMIDAAGRVRRALGLGQGWQQQRLEDRDDGDHHQQFDEREGVFGF